jgi:ethanolamine utilization microcompartment shell protein EutS
MTIDGVFGLNVGFIDRFNTQLVITLNYSAIAVSHTLQAFEVRSVFTSNWLVTAPTMAIPLLPC